jgi:hypothetical protein
MPVATPGIFSAPIAELVMLDGDTDAKACAGHHIH